MNVARLINSLSNIAGDIIVVTRSEYDGAYMERTFDGVDFVQRIGEKPKVVLIQSLDEVPR